MEETTFKGSYNEKKKKKKITFEEKDSPDKKNEIDIIIDKKMEDDSSFEDPTERLMEEVRALARKAVFYTFNHF